MKNLLFITSFGLAVFFSNATFGQEAVAGDTSRQEKKVNPKSNSKHDPNRTFGKDRAAEVKAKNGESEKIAEQKDVKRAGDADNKKDNSADKEAKKQDKEAKKQLKEAKKAEKERLKAEKKMVKKNKLK